MYSTYSKKIKFYQQYLISLSIDNFHTFFTRLLGSYFALYYVYISIRLFFYLLSISFLFSSLILSTTFILIPTSQTTCITPLQYGAFVELFLKQTKKASKKSAEQTLLFSINGQDFFIHYFLSKLTLNFVGDNTKEKKD